MIKSLNLSNSRKDVEERIGESVPDNKYLAFVRIFEGMKNLEEIRSDLKSDQIQKVKTIDKKPPKIVAFPDIEKNHSTYKTLHDSLSSIISSELGLIDTDTVAGQEMLKKRRAVLLRLLWIVANYGVIDDTILLVDSITINTHKKGTSGFPTTEGGWRRWLEILSDEGLHGNMQFAPLEKSELTSPIGWLRERIPGTNDPVWSLSISLDEQHGGFETLQKLRSYAKALDEEYGKRAFGRFTKADMRYLESKD
jgi:hypothetical protein